MKLIADTNRIGCWIYLHTRAYDTVHFGPFATHDELVEWLNTVGKAYGVSGMAIPIVNPESEPTRFWEKLYSVADE